MSDYSCLGKNTLRWFGARIFLSVSIDLKRTGAAMIWNQNNSERMDLHSLLSSLLQCLTIPTLKTLRDHQEKSNKSKNIKQTNKINKPQDLKIPPSKEIPPKQTNKQKKPQQKKT